MTTSGSPPESNAGEFADCGSGAPARGSPDILERLAAVIEARRDSDPETSYVARLHQRGLDTVLKKLGEEAAETIIAAKNPDRDALVGEVADLWFHAVVLLVQRGIAPAEVLGELERRFGLSGVAEKAARTEAGQRSDRGTKDGA